MTDHCDDNDKSITKIVHSFWDINLLIVSASIWRHRLRKWQMYVSLFSDIDYLKNKQQHISLQLILSLCILCLKIWKNIFHPHFFMMYACACPCKWKLPWATYEGVIAHHVLLTGRLIKRLPCAGSSWDWSRVARFEVRSSWAASHRFPDCGSIPSPPPPPHAPRQTSALTRAVEEEVVNGEKQWGDGNIGRKDKESGGEKKCNKERGERCRHRWLSG